MVQRSERDAEVAFVVAALALLALPLLVMVGAAALGLASMSGMRDIVATGGSGIVLGMFVGWVVLAVVIVLLVAARLMRSPS